MKKRLLTFAFMILSVCIFSTKTFAQDVPGGEAGDGGSGGVIPDPGNTGGGTTTPTALIFNLGSAGSFSIPSTACYYSCVTSILNYFHIPIVNGVVTFSTTYSNYNGCMFGLYCTRTISYNTYHTACSNPPPTCHR